VREDLRADAVLSSLGPARFLFCDGNRLRRIKFVVAPALACLEPSLGCDKESAMDGAKVPDADVSQTEQLVKLNHPGLGGPQTSVGIFSFHRKTPFFLAFLVLA